MVQMSFQWFQQDGAPSHTTKDAQAFLRQHFRNWLISARGSQMATVFSLGQIFSYGVI